jgi:hypothetical protein
LAAAVLGRPPEVDIDDPTVAQDAWWLVGPDSADKVLRSYRRRTASGPAYRPAGGVVVMGAGQDHIVVDVGPIGFRGRGGHGHLDAMSFEATLGGKVVVRDSGTGSYSGDPSVREELRSARAHTVVMCDGLPYARLGGRDRLWVIEGDSVPVVERLEGDSSRQVLRAVQRLPAAEGEATHSRELVWRPGQLRCHDQVTAPPGALIEHLMQVPGDVQLEGRSARSSCGLFRLDFPIGATISIERCRTSDRYGSTTPASRLVVTYRAAGSSTAVTWHIKPL